MNETVEAVRTALRREVLEMLGADATETEELLAYNRNVFEPSPELVEHGLPLPDEPFVEAWESYALRSSTEGALAVLRDVLVQLRFPIREGTSHDKDYQAATRRGEWPLSQGSGIPLEQPDGVRIRLEGTPAGRIPVIVVSSRADFEALVRAVTARNEPVPISRSVNAFMVSGYVNWDRVRRYRRRWSVSNPDGDWRSEFRRLADRRPLYQDRFIVACRGTYSGIDADALGLDPEQWQALSLEIRVGHESAHYFTKRAFSSMRNNLLDELIADYAGLVVAFGRFRADWFLHFLGLENFPRYRVGGRLDTYRGDPPLSEGAFTILKAVVARAAATVETVDHQLFLEAEPGVNGRMIRALTCVTLEELASGNGAERLRLALPEK
ncbi:MAG: hypothetical protein LJE91_07550 [Gammaproteobacteria bacterium]|jgi:hypothetical protein|nr:hypothetical protein [Gammaproteobacteria bacterium]